MSPPAGSGEPDPGPDPGLDPGLDPGRDPGPDAVPAPPPAAGLAALASDDWAWLLPPLRRALHDLDDRDASARVVRLRTAPAGRLAGGRHRHELIRLLAAGGPVWAALAARLERLETPAAVAAALAGQVAPAEPAGSAPVPADAAAEELRRARDRARRLRSERDELRRKLEGAEARARRHADQLASAEAAVAQAQDARREAERELAEADAERARTVARARRRAAARISQLEEELRTVRGEADRREREADRRTREVRDQAARERAEVAEVRPGPERLVPGRPSRLPADVHPGTREAVEVLLHPGRLVLVDGYNLTKQHHPELGLQRQRAWLVQLLGVLVARRRVQATVVFDGAGVGSRPSPGVRDVAVRFTPTGVTADDELVLAVEATDEPVLVVTDDRELVGRLRASGADVVGTREFLWATR